MASIHKRTNGRYRVMWRDHTGRQRARDVAKLTDARALRSDIEEVQQVSAPEDAAELHVRVDLDGLTAKELEMVLRNVAALATSGGVIGPVRIGEREVGEWRREPKLIDLRAET